MNNKTVLIILALIAACPVNAMDDNKNSNNIINDKQYEKALTLKEFYTTRETKFLNKKSLAYLFEAVHCKMPVPTFYYERLMQYDLVPCNPDTQMLVKNMFKKNELTQDFELNTQIMQEYKIQKKKKNKDIRTKINAFYNVRSSHPEGLMVLRYLKDVTTPIPLKLKIHDTKLHAALLKVNLDPADKDVAKMAQKIIGTDIAGNIVILQKKY